MRCENDSNPAKMRTISNGRGKERRAPLCDDCVEGMTKNSGLVITDADDGTIGDTLPTEPGMQL